MEIGISSYTYTWAVGVPGFCPANPLRHLDLLEKAAAIGARVVQFADNLPLDSLSISDLKALARKAHELGISIELGTRGIHFQSIRTYVRLAEKLKSPILRTLIDIKKQSFSEQEIIERLRNIEALLRRTGVNLAIENHDSLSVKILAQIVAKVGSEHIGICLDTANSLGVPEQIETVISHLGRFTMNLHLKDFSIHRLPHLMGFIVEGKPAGQGMLDIPWLLQRLEKFQRDPNIIIELWTPLESNLDKTIRKEERWAKASIEYVHTLVN